MRNKALSQFTGVMNTDIDPHLLPPGDYIDALNMLHGEAGVAGYVTNPLGTNSITFPTAQVGTKRVIGAVEDKQKQNLFYFIQNQTNPNLNQIARWDPYASEVVEVCRGSSLAFNADRRIQGHVIDGKYMYWTDGRVVGNDIIGEEPRKINVEKAVKLKRGLNSWLYSDIWNPEVFASGNSYLFRVRNSVNTVTYSVTFTADGAYEGNIYEGLIWLKEQIEADAGLDALINVTLCGECRLEIQNLTEGSYIELVATKDDAIIAPIDWYPFLIQDYHMSLIKQPPACAPIPTYIKNTETAINNVMRGCYQFRVRYIYDDEEKSAWGPISQVAINKNIDGTPNEYLNAIEVDFTDARFASSSWMSIIRGVEIAMRDGNDGLWKMIKTLDICDLGIMTNKYVWSNDLMSIPVASDDPSQGNPSLQVLKLFDEVPLVAATMEVTTGTESDQRLYLGNLKEGYDCIECPEIQAYYGEYVGNECFTSITGTVQVFATDGVTQVDPNFRDYALGGFVVYLAGTQYYAISDNPADGTGSGTFTIPRVPKGQYILRVAAPYCRFDNDNGARHNIKNGLEWQKTSAPMFDCAGSVAVSGFVFERAISIGPLTGETFNLDTEPGYGPIKIHNGYWEGVGGLFEVYVWDGGGDNALAEAREGAIGVELLEVTLSFGPTVTKDTDHNGYFWCFKGDGTGNSFSLDIPGMDHYQFIQAPFAGDMSIIFTDAGTLPAEVENDPSDPKGVYPAGSPMLFIFNSRDTWTTLYRRTLSGRTIDKYNGPVSGALISLEYGRTAITDYAGYWSIAMYPINDGFIVPSRSSKVYPTYLNDICFKYPAAPIDFLTGTFPWEDDVVPDFVFSFAGAISYSERILKRGANYSFGIVYEDNGGRTCGVTFLTEFHIPFFTENLTFQKLVPVISIRHQPPIWATRYKMVRTKNMTHRSYFQWVTDEIRFGVVVSPAEDPFFSTFSADNWTHLFIRVNSRDIQGTDQALLMFFQEAKEGYTAQIGDRVRFITDNANNFINQGSILELDVVGRFIEDENYYVVVPRVEFETEPTGGWLFEFYTPKRLDEIFFYETGQCYDVIGTGEANIAHASPIQDQDPFTHTPALVNIEGGDTYWRVRSFASGDGDGVSLNLEHKTMTSYHQEPCEDIGRAFAQVENPGIWRYNRVRFSGLYLPGSKVNGLSSFGALDYQDLNRSFGPIINLSHVGNVMLAICMNKCQSLYVGRGRVLDLRGNESVGRSDQIISIADESLADAGTMHPESVVINHGRVYWWDIRRGRVWRYSQAGVEAVDRGMYGTFQSIANLRKNLDPTDDFCPAGYDRLNDLYLLTFNSGTYLGNEEVPITINGDTYAFSDQANGWRTRFSFNPTVYGMVLNELASFLDVTGTAWRHNKNLIRNRFYNTGYLSEIKFSVNQIPQAVKDWHCISVHTDKKWSAPSIQIPANLNYNYGMLSRLKVNKWNSYEGIWCADFLGDMYDTSGVFLAIADLPTRYATALQLGRRLKGNVLIITLQSADTAGVAFKLWETTTEFSLSHKTSV